MKKIFFKSSFILINIFFLSMLGCVSAYNFATAHYEVLDESEDLKSKKFEIVEGRSIVYLYQKKSFFFNFVGRIKLDGKFYSDISGGAYLAIPLDPGAYTFETTSLGNNPIRITVNPKELYFIELNRNAVLIKVSEEEGRKEILDCCRLIKGTYY